MQTADHGLNFIHTRFLPLVCLQQFINPQLSQRLKVAMDSTEPTSSVAKDSSKEKTPANHQHGTDNRRRGTLPRTQNQAFANLLKLSCTEPTEVKQTEKREGF